MSKEHSHSNPLTRDEVLNNLLESIAQEEMALADLIEAEAAKLQAFVGKQCNFPTRPSNKEIVTMNKSVTSLLETIVMKEWLLLKKLEDVIDFESDTPECKHPKKHKDKTCGCFGPLGSLE